MPVDGVTWTTSDPSVAAFSVEDPSSLEAVGPGDATVTATLDSLTATAQVTVVAGETLPVGTVSWAADPPAGLVPGGSVYTYRVDSTVPELYGVEYDGSRVQYRGYAWNGDAVRVDVPALSDGEYVSQTMGDTSGGLVVAFDAGVVRFAGPDDTVPWRYDASGSVQDIAQGADGVIYVVEVMSDGFTEVVLLDGETGAAFQRVGLRLHSVWKTWNWDCEPNRNYSGEDWAGVGPISVGHDGTAYLPVVTREDYYDYEPCGVGTGHWTGRAYLLSVTADGSSTLQLLHEATSDDDYWAVGTWGTTQALPDDSGGVLTTWLIDHADHGESLSIYVRDGGTTTYTLPGSAWTQGSPAVHSYRDLVGDDGLAYLGGDLQLALDMATGTVRMTSAEPGQPVVPLADGGAWIQDGNLLKDIDATGSLIDNGLVPLDDDYLKSRPSSSVTLGPGGPTPAVHWFTYGFGNQQNGKGKKAGPKHHLTDVSETGCTKTRSAKY